MKVLFVTLCALETNTSVTKSNLGLLKGLKDLGYDVTIIMPEISDALAYYDNYYDLSSYKVIRFKCGGLGNKVAALNQSSSVLKKYLVRQLRSVYQKISIFDRTKEYINYASSIPVYEEYYDILLSTSDPKTSHLFAKRMIDSGLKYGKWIQHWGDPLYGDISRSLIYPKFYLKRVEKSIIRNANTIVYVSPFTAEEQKNNYPDFANKIRFVPLACDDEEIDANKNCETLGLVNAVYLGDYSSHIRNIIPLYEAVKRMDNIHLTIAGGTDLSLSSTKNITILPRVSTNTVKELESKASILISIGNLCGTQIPGKLYYSASSQKNILVTIDGDNKDAMFDYLNSFGRFDICDNKCEDIMHALSSIINRGDKSFKTPIRLLPCNVMKEILL